MSSTTAVARTSIDLVTRVKSNGSTYTANSSEKVTKVSSNVTRQGEFGYPNGHLGRLTREQEDSLAEFRKILAVEGLYVAGTEGSRPSHTDSVLLRFLRARRFVPPDALEQFKTTEKWRKLNELDNLYLNIDVDDFEESKRHYPQWLGVRDKRGMPVYLYRVGALDSKTMSVYTKSATDIKMAIPEKDSVSKKDKNKNPKEKTPPRLLRLFSLYESPENFMFQLCTVLTDRANPEVPITQSNNLVDISNVGLKQFWNLRNHMQDASVLATAHYPETLDRIFIVGAPSFFPTVWSWIKRWFDPITVSKIFILSEAEVLPTLSQFISPESIPKQYGGSLDLEIGAVPTIEPIYADRLAWKDDGASGIRTAKGELRRWPRGPIAWVQREDGDLDLLAVGSVGGKQRREVVATFKLDHPYGGWADKSIPHPKHRDEALTSNESEATEQNSVSSPLKTTENTSSDLPPATTSIEASIPPVPLAAIAQPLPEK